MTSPNSSTSHHGAGAPAGVWFKSSFSNPNGNQCVEVFFDNDLVLIRDSKDQGTGPIIKVPAEHWPGFLAEATRRADAGGNQALRIEHAPDGTTRLHALDSGTALSYTSAEWAAFVAGAVAGEFDVRRAGARMGAATTA